MGFSRFSQKKSIRQSWAVPTAMWAPQLEIVETIECRDQETYTNNFPSASSFFHSIHILHGPTSNIAMQTRGCCENKSDVKYGIMN